jgi:PAS domain S-box-containing protein
MLPEYIPSYAVAPLLGLSVNGILALLCLTVFAAYRSYRPLMSLSLFYLTLTGYFLGFTIYAYQTSDRSIIEGYRLMLLSLCFAPVAWVWFALHLQNARPGPWAWASLAFAVVLAVILLFVEHPAVLGEPLNYLPRARVWRPTSQWLKPILHAFDLLVVLTTLFFFWFRWWPAPGKPAFVRALVAGLALWFLCGLHDAAYALKIPFTFNQPITWLGSVWLSLCLAVTIAFHLRDLEMSLRQSEMKFAKAFAANPDGLTLATREEGRFLEVNEAFLNFCGWRREDILGRTCVETGLWVNPDDREVMLAQIDRLGEVRDMEVPFRVSSGQIREVLLSAQAIAFGGQDCLLIVTRDITERKAVEAELDRHRLHLEELVAERTSELVQANSGLQSEVAERMRTEAALRESQTKLQSLFDSLEDFLFVLDHEGNLLLVNPPVLEVLGYEMDQLVGQSALQLYPPRRRPEATQVWNAIMSGHSDSSLIPLFSRGGREIPVETKITRGNWGNQEAVFGISRDISERIKAQEVLRQLAAGVAHNFNNLLAAILSNAQAAETALKPDRADVSRARQLVDNVVYSALSGRGVVKRLAAYVGGRAQGRGAAASCQVAEVVGAALDIAQAAFRTSVAESVVIETDLKPGLWVKVPRDELMEICLNLVRNAMPRGGCLSVTSGLRDQQAWLCFADTGGGMNRITLARIFEPFFTTKGVAGQGLGLASSRGIIRAYGGDLTAESRPGQGTALTLNLGPVLSKPPVEPSDPAAMPPPGLKVLLVEDEALVAMGTRAVLESAGLVVQVASQVSEAATALDTFAADVVLCDLGLPDGTGWDVARLLASSPRRQPGETPLIFLTGWGAEGSPHPPPPDLAPAWGLLQKPVDRGLLLRTLAKAAARS